MVAHVAEVEAVDPVDLGLDQRERVRLRIAGEGRDRLVAERRSRRTHDDRRAKPKPIRRRSASPPHRPRRPRPRRRSGRPVPPPLRRGRRASATERVSRDQESAQGASSHSRMVMWCARVLAGLELGEDLGEQRRSARRRRSGGGSSRGSPGGRGRSRRRAARGRPRRRGGSSRGRSPRRSAGCVCAFSTTATSSERFISS